MNTSAAASKPRRRRRIRFGLGTVFGIVTLVAVWLAIVATRHRARMAEIAELKSQGVTLLTEPTGPTWLRNLLGKDYCSKVVAAEITVAHLDDETVRAAGSRGDVQQAIAAVARVRERIASFDVSDDDVTVLLRVNHDVPHFAVVKLIDGLSHEAGIGRFGFHAFVPAAADGP